MPHSEIVGWILVVVFGFAFLLITPQLVELFTLLNLIIYIVLALLALSLALIWGYGGILCFGQTAFYGLGAYTYAIAAINLNNTPVALVLAILFPAMFAAILGWFIFYGRLSDVYMGIITLAVALILFKLINSTAGDQYIIGTARLGGFNGIHGVPTLTLLPDALFYICAGFFLLIYCGLRWLLISHFGQVIVAIRENERRAQLLGYDVRWHKTVLFCIGGAIAGLAGALFVNWGGYADPGLFSLFQSAQIIMWVIVGGLGTLIGPVMGACLLHFVTTQLGALAIINNNLILGVILIFFVLLMPRGIITAIVVLWRRLRKHASNATKSRTSFPHKTRSS